MSKNYYVIFMVISLFVISCQSKTEKEIEERNAYLLENNITVAPKESGLYYIETLEGTGSQPQTEDYVKVHYTGKFLDGEIFDSSYDRGEPIDFYLGVGQVIKGWDEGISYMKEGGKATLIIPSELAYGAYGSASGTIPPYTTLVFDVELIEVK